MVTTSRLTVSEDDLLTACLDMARNLRVLVHHSRPARTGKGWRTPIAGDKGLPDLILAGPGGLVLAELKAAAGRLSPEQTRWLTTLAAAGVEVHVWRPVDLRSGRILATIRRLSTPSTGETP